MVSKLDFSATPKDVLQYYLNVKWTFLFSVRRQISPPKTAGNYLPKNGLFIFFWWGGWCRKILYFSKKSSENGHKNCSNFVVDILRTPLPLSLSYPTIRAVGDLHVEAVPWNANGHRHLAQDQRLKCHLEVGWRKEQTAVVHARSSWIGA